MVLMNTHYNACRRCADKLIKKAEKALDRSETEWSKNFWYGVWKKLRSKYQPEEITYH